MQTPNFPCSSLLKKKKVDENLAIGLLTTLASIIIGKIIFYYMVNLVEKGMKYFQGKPNYKKQVKDILAFLYAVVFQKIC